MDKTTKRIRIMAILQLCIAFTLIFSSAGYPFLGELFAFKSKALLYHSVIGDSTLAGNANSADAEEYRGRLDRDKIRFSELPKELQSNILSQYQNLKDQTEKSFSAKFWRGIHILAFELSAFERAWLLLSIMISILLLFRIEGAALAVWLLPLLVICYGIDNQLNGISSSVSADTALFPPEEMIVNNYLKKPLSANIMEQRDQLLLGWKQYLIQEWAHQEPSSDNDLFDKQAEEGEFAFNVARVKLLSENQKMDLPFKNKESMFLIGLYVFWNLFFASIANRRAKIQNSLA